MEKIFFEIYIEDKIESVFHSVAESPEIFPKLFRGFFPFITSIEKIETENNEAMKEGILRTLTMGDGSKVKERVLVHKSPFNQKYEMAEMNLTQELFLFNMIGEFILKEESGKVLVRWEYSFFPTKKIITKIGIGLLIWAFGKAMKNCLDNLKKFHEVKK